MSRLKGTYKEIIDIALPLMLGNMAWALIGITDQAFMGHYGKTEEAAIGPVSIFYSILFMVGFGYTRGIQIMIARSCGEGDKKQVGKIFDNTCMSWRLHRLY
jgi:Na+-driven multidrug efflux pump